ncbi:PREDICTED: cell cycle checkpoint control protein RAD9A-like [Gekko japonicus]|uniref:Cell cycle checkpoint control protein RAD9A-like n=1 Tax=Gekko japonicus TaxID=146911 RepID=A0ABM1KM84_GEKJA|nr:PREDICTED: cell cycle checkpoint control protein RAD9A-like [Gekko japonicus]
MIAMETMCAGVNGVCPAPSSLLPTRKNNSDTKDLDSDHEGTVPGTPPQKKFRSLFFGSVLNQSQTLLYPGSGQEVLAEDSEGES